MNIVKDLAEKTMTEEKRAQAKNDIFAFYIGRPISYVLTVPFLKMGISPNTVSFLSLFPSIIGFFLIGFGNTMTLKIVGWCMFFLWNLLDGVDGNIARYKEQFSKNGALWDATSGYVAMVLSFYSMGIGCFYGDFTRLAISKEICIVLGGLSAILVIFPRLIMHKRISSMGEDKNAKEYKDKSSYGILKVIALNLISISGFVQVLMLLSIIFKFMDVFTVAYFVINLLICIVSVRKLLK